MSDTFATARLCIIMVQKEDDVDAVPNLEPRPGGVAPGQGGGDDCGVGGGGGGGDGGGGGGGDGGSRGGSGNSGGSGGGGEDVGTGGDGGGGGDSGGGVEATFQVLYMTGWSPGRAGQPACPNI